MTIIPVILSGGSGTRLWPLSRAAFPKQLISLISENTMIQETIKRVEGQNVLSPVVVCNEKHRFIIAEQLNQIGVKNPSIILEPIARNTAPAIAAAAFRALQIDKDSVIVVLPSDHNIQNVKVLQDAVQTAAKEAMNDSLVTFGITPTFAATGYGYIEAASKEGVSDIKRFVEKPDAATAQKYLDSGNFLWNSGMFVFKARCFLDELKVQNKEIFECTKQSFEKAAVETDFIRLEKDSFGKNPSISIDYAVMEKTNKGKVVPLNAGWSDVGSWSSLWEVSEKDADGNVIKGDAITLNSKNNLIFSKNKKTTVIGLENIVIVDTPDALLVAEKSKAESVKDIVDILKSQNNPIASENTWKQD